MFEDKWKKGSLSEPVKTKVTQLVTGKIFYIIAMWDVQRPFVLFLNINTCVGTY